MWNQNIAIINIPRSKIHTDPYPPKGCAELLVGGWTNPSKKYARQIGSSHQVQVKNENNDIETTTQITLQ